MYAHRARSPEKSTKHRSKSRHKSSDNNRSTKFAMKGKGKSKLNQDDAATIIQKHYRGYRERQNYHNMKAREVRTDYRRKSRQSNMMRSSAAAPSAKRLTSVEETRPVKSSNRSSGSAKPRRSTSKENKHPSRERGERDTTRPLKSSAASSSKQTPPHSSKPRDKSKREWQK